MCIFIEMQCQRGVGKVIRQGVYKIYIYTSEIFVQFFHIYCSGFVLYEKSSYITIVHTIATVQYEYQLTIFWTYNKFKLPPPCVSVCCCECNTLKIKTP